MSHITDILKQLESGDPSAAEELLPLVYEELRKLAIAKLSKEKPGQTLQATDLVHEAYVRLVGDGCSREANPGHWDGRAHFFAAAAEAMRRILVDRARARNGPKRGGGLKHQCIDNIDIPMPRKPQELLAVDEALDNLEGSYPQAAHLVKLRYFMGMTIPEAAALLGVSPRKANQIWTFARAWLIDALGQESI